MDGVRIQPRVVHRRRRGAGIKYAIGVGMAVLSEWNFGAVAAIIHAMAKFFPEVICLTCFSVQASSKHRVALKSPLNDSVSIRFSLFKLLTKG